METSRGEVASLLVGRCSVLRRRSVHMAKKSRGGRMTAAKRRAAKAPGGKGPIKKRRAGRRIMKT